MKKHELDKICDESELIQDHIGACSSVYSLSKPEPFSSQSEQHARYIKSSISRGFEVLSVFEGKDDRTQKELQSVSESPWVNTVMLLDNVGLASQPLGDQSVDGILRIGDEDPAPPLVEMLAELELTVASYKQKNLLFSVLEASFGAKSNDADVFSSQHLRSASSGLPVSGQESLSSRVFRALNREAENMRTSSAVVFRAALGAYQKERENNSSVQISGDSSIDDALNGLDSIDSFFEEAESRPISLLSKRGFSL